MNKGEERLRELLGRLRDRLTRARTVDEDSRKLLATVVQDIDSALAKDPEPTGNAAGAAGTHTPRLELLAVRFEADHPGLAEVIREVIDALARVGI